jgi:8-oxo-dGTP pyrophosphatase MutT (NUDIX family)
MLDLDPNREPATPKDAATLIVVREASDAGVEVFCVRRHAKSAFMGGVIVFPGGKLDASDADEAVAVHCDGLHPRATVFADDADHGRALAVCACREALEEAAILPASPSPTAEATEKLRRALEEEDDFGALVHREKLTLTTSKLVPFARWVTPTAESRRYDARFFVTELPRGQEGKHDDHETTSSLWATPGRVLDAYMAGDLFLAPPTMRVLEILGDAGSVAGAIEACASQSLLPICPEVVDLNPVTLALPGDPAHSIAERRVSGPTKYLMVDGKFVYE